MVFSSLVKCNLQQQTTKGKMMTIYKSGLTKKQYWFAWACCMVPIVGLPVWAILRMYNHFANKGTNHV
jgi:hypothetical protein